MSTTLSVRTATVADLPAVTDLFLRYLEFYGVAVPDEERPAAFLAERLKNGDSVVLLAETPAGPVGFAQVYRTFSSLSMGTVWTLNDLYVREEARGAGAGRALVRACLEHARAAGAVGIQLETAPDNHVAQSLYDSEGFERERFVAYHRSLDG
ncbi:N-acetyltransferase [Streptomyces macrosporus]|uniref:GNAT family N-acetyltransferase n=1 Tax=Streptomyces macrosporus TaxID=44032 RepID=A0ABP5XY49_9ACTN